MAPLRVVARRGLAQHGAAPDPAPNPAPICRTMRRGPARLGTARGAIFALARSSVARRAASRRYALGAMHARVAFSLCSLNVVRSLMTTILSIDRRSLVRTRRSNHEWARSRLMFDSIELVKFSIRSIMCRRVKLDPCESVRRLITL